MHISGYWIIPALRSVFSWRFYCCIGCYIYITQERESQKLHWLQRSVQELSDEKWVIPALKQMREICLLYLEVSCVNHSATCHFLFH